MRVLTTLPRNSRRSVARIVTAMRDDAVRLALIVLCLIGIAALLYAYG